MGSAKPDVARDEDGVGEPADLGPADADGVRLVSGAGMRSRTKRIPEGRVDARRTSGPVAFALRGRDGGWRTSR
jgi:hypothetical protein